MVEIRIDDTGHFYRNKAGGPWINMEKEAKNQSMLDELQLAWSKVTGVVYPQPLMLHMLELAEKISVSYVINSLGDKDD